MYNSDPLGESATITGLKAVGVLFIFLALLAFPLLQSSIGGQLALFTASVDQSASSGANLQPAQQVNPNEHGEAVSYRAKPVGLDGLAN